MYLKKVDGPRQVSLPDGSVLTRADLPAESTRRWVASRKAVVVRAVIFGLITESEAMERYALSPEEFQSWCQAVRLHGEKALRVTSIQKYRQLYRIGHRPGHLGAGGIVGVDPALPAMLQGKGRKTGPDIGKLNGYSDAHKAVQHGPLALDQSLGCRDSADISPQRMIADIPQVACRSMARSTNFVCRTSVLCPVHCPLPPDLQKAGRSGRNPASSWPSIEVFQHAGQTCPAAFAEFGPGSRSCA